MLEASFGDQEIPEEKWTKLEFPDNQVNAVVVGRMNDDICQSLVEKIGIVFGEEIYSTYKYFDGRIIQTVPEKDKLVILMSPSGEDGSWQKIEVLLPLSKIEERKKD